MANNFLKRDRTFTFIRKHAWIMTLLIAIVGQWYPKLGLIVVFIMAGLIITAFFKGRYWCGNICPHGSLFDRIFLPISLNRKIPDFFKSTTSITVVFLFFMFNFGRNFISIISHWSGLDSLDKLGLLFSNTYLMVFIVGGFLAAVVNPRTWCQVCPMGTMQKASHSLGEKLNISTKFEEKVTISHQDKCLQCGLCTKVCPFQLEPYKEWDSNNQFSNKDCIKCNTCIEYCPVKILSMEKNRTFK